MKPAAAVLIKSGAIGMVAGLLSGLLGVGGGIVMVPALVLALRLGQHEAHGTSLAAIVPIAASAVVVFGAADEVDVPAGLLLAVGSIPGARAGALWMRRLPERRLRMLFGVFLLVIAGALLVR